MNISGRKIENYYGEEKYLFDIIVEHPESIKSLMDDSVNWDFTDDEREFYELVTTKCPTTEIRINSDDFKKLFEPYSSEIVFTDSRIKEYTQLFYKSLENYNKNLETNYYEIDILNVIESRYRNQPWDNILFSNIKIPKIYDMYVVDIKQRLQGIRQKYKKGKLSPEFYESEERLRGKIKDLEEGFRLMITGYGVKFSPYFEAWATYCDKKIKAACIYQEFRGIYHYRGIMNFGKYSGKKISYVIKHDLQYIEWALKNKSGFILRGDDLENFIKEAGYVPATTGLNDMKYPSNGIITNIASFLNGTECKLDSVVFKTIKIPETKALIGLSEKYPGLNYSIIKNGEWFNISFSGNFEPKTKDSYDDM